MKQPHAMTPNWEDFVRAINGRFPVAAWDPSKPFAEQVKGVLVVIDDGGSQGTPRNGGCVRGGGREIVAHHDERA